MGYNMQTEEDIEELKRVTGRILLNVESLKAGVDDLRRIVGHLIRRLDGVADTENIIHIVK